MPVITDGLIALEGVFSPCMTPKRIPSTQLPIIFIATLPASQEKVFVPEGTYPLHMCLECPLLWEGDLGQFEHVRATGEIARSD